MLGDLSSRLAEHDHWYHTIELPGGNTTPGLYDMPRILPRVGMPDSLEGKRCLDVGTGDGFWAFEMERRGASEVVATDVEGWHLLDWPPAPGSRPRTNTGQISPRFALAHEALASRVEWVPISVYDTRPELLGTFDLVFVGSMLLHLRDPVRALAAVRTVVRGELLLNEVVSLPLTMLRPRRPAARLVGIEAPTWWIPNVAGLRRLVEAAGFRILDAGKPYYLRFGKGRLTAPEQTLTPITTRPLYRLPLSVLQNARDRLGIPHAWLRAAPRADLLTEPQARVQNGESTGP